MTWRGCGLEAGDQPLALTWRLTADGSPSLWSEAFAQAFHCRSGALSESRAKFIRPAQLERFRPGDRLRVVEVCVGLGYNTASLLEAANDYGLDLVWWGFELDPRPLALALAEPRFRGLWRPSTLEALAQLQVQGHWRQLPSAPDGATSAGSAQGPSFPPSAAEMLGESPQSMGVQPPSLGARDDPDPTLGHRGPQRPSRGRWWLGDARRELRQLPLELSGGCDLVFLDAFSPGQCPQLWTREFLGQLAALLRPEGRLLTYCTAAAVRRGLELAGLQLASLRPEHHPPPQHQHSSTPGQRHWSAGTVASPTPLPVDALLRPLSAMEREHLLCRAAVPYRDPLGCAAPELIEAQRCEEQQRDLGLLSTSAWRRRWGVER
ncbi:MAG: MnmC family methyltransferase [Synechococcaceae cyanobacterium]